MSRTRRQQMAALLEARGSTARELAEAFGLPLRVVLDDLEHLARSRGRALRVAPPLCQQCGFRFRERRRFTRPSRCPRCRSERVSWPRVSLDPP